MKAEIKQAQLGVSNTKLAASLHSLGFCDWKADAIQEERGGHMRITFLFKGGCARPEYAPLIKLTDASLLLRGMLEKNAPMHPLCVAMRGQNNHDMLAAAARDGSTVRLIGVAGGRMTIYVKGEDPAFARGKVETVPVDDLDLAASLGGVGLPVVRIEGTHPRFRFHVATTGYAVETDTLNAPRVECAQALIARSPTPQDPLRLELELTNPMHPVCVMYEALFARARFRQWFKHVTPLLHMGGASKVQALVTMNATGRVMKMAEHHRKAPPMDWTGK